MSLRDDIVAIAKDASGDRRLDGVLDEFLSDEARLYPPGVQDAIKLRDGHLVLCRVRLRPLAGKLVALATSLYGVALHGSTIGVLGSVLSIALQVSVRERLTRNASAVCLLLAGLDPVPVTELYAYVAELARKEEREMSRELFDHVLDELESRRVVRFVGEDRRKVELAETLEL